MILSGFHSNEKTNTSLYVGIYYLQWRLVELPTSITRRLIAVYIYDAHSSPKIQNSFHGVIHSRRIAARQLHNRIWGLFGNLQNWTMSKNGKTKTCRRCL